MMDVAGAAWGADAARSSTQSSIKPGFEMEAVAPAGPTAREPASQAPRPQEQSPREPTPKDIKEIGGFVGNKKAGIEWGKGIKNQGDNFEAYIAGQDPEITRLPPGSKTFDLSNQMTGEATSAKTLNTLSFSYIRYPQKILGKLKNYVDAVADHDRPRAIFDLDPAKIRSRTVQLAISEYTFPTQWRYLNRASGYARERGVSLVITTIRE